MWYRSLLGVLALVAMILAGPQTQARVVKGAAAEKIAAMAADYVSSINTLASDFSFVTVNGKSTGHIFMDRTTQSIRMQFGEPLNHLLLVKGPLTKFFGGEGTVVEVATAGTPLSFLLHPKKSLSTNIQVLEVDERGTSVFVAVAERGNVAAGQAILHFQREPTWRLIDWGVYDAKGRFSKTVLGQQETGLRLDPALFAAPE
jgi:outer membrane lipoprotein-sorting protein